LFKSFNVFISFSFSFSFSFIELFIEEDEEGLKANEDEILLSFLETFNEFILELSLLWRFED